MAFSPAGVTVVSSRGDIQSTNDNIIGEIEVFSRCSVG